MTEKWCSLSVEQLEKRLNTDIRSGLSQKTAKSRRTQIGDNIVYPIPKNSFYSYIKHVLTDLTSILLLLTAAVSIFFGYALSGTTIIIMLFLHYLFAVFTYVKAQRVLEGVGRFSIPTAKVIRDGKLYITNSELLSPGDVICVSVGDIVPADARLVDSDGLSALEVNLTSRVKATPKDAAFIGYGDIPPIEQKNMIFASSILTSGSGKAVVCSVGDDTLVRRKNKNSNITTHDKLEIFKILKKYCASWSLIMIALIFLLTIADLCTGLQERSLFDIFLTGLSLAVASMSELYMAFGYITVACGIFNSISRYKNLDSGALIKNVAKLSDLKDINCLILPKDGAFTVKDQTVEQIYANGKTHMVSDKDQIPKCAEVLRYAVISTGLYGANILASNNESRKNVYSAEEMAIISAAEMCSVYNINLDRLYPMLEHRGIDSDSKLYTTLVKYDGAYIVAVRGEFEAVINRSAFYFENGLTYHLSAEKANELKIAATMITKQSYHVIAVASKVSEYNNLQFIGAAQSELVFEGFLAIREPVLSGAAQNVERCRSAGIRVIMLTDGEHENNISVAETVGIIKDRSESVRADEIYEMGDDMFRTNIPIYNLYEGLNVPQKRLLIKYLHESGMKIGVLGNELDDLGLMSESDVSFSQAVTIIDKKGKASTDIVGRMVPINIKSSVDTAQSGCEAIKFISDVVISEADKQGAGGFNAILRTIGQAKTIYKNLLRMVRYLIVSQLSRFFIVLYSVIMHDTLFSPTQILFCGLFVDFLAVIIIAFEKPSVNILKQKEDTGAKLRRPLFNNILLVLIAMFIAASSVLVLKIALSNHIIMSDETGTVLFLSYVLTQFVLLSEIKKDKSIFISDVKINLIYMSLFLFVAVFFALGVIIPTVGGVLGILPLGYLAWCIIPVLPLLTTAIFELYKLIYRES